MIKLINILKETKVSPKGNTYPQIITVIKDGYYIDENISTGKIIDIDEFERSYIPLLVKGDVWKFIEINEYDNPVYECIKGRWLWETSDGWWSYNNIKDFFQAGYKNK